MLKVLARGVATVGIVSTLVFAMPIAASADAWDYALFELIASAGVGGAGGAVAGTGVVAAAPEMAGAGFACAAALPVCAAVGGAVIGATLYLTKDTWVPWITNGVEFLTGANEGWSLSPDGYRVKVDDSSGPGGMVFRFERVHTGTEGTFVVPMVYGTVTCADTSTRIFYDGPGISDANGGSYGHWYSGDPLASQVPNVSNFGQCEGRGGPVGFTGLAGNGATGPEVITWGAGAVSTAPPVASLQVSCTNPDGSQYEVTSSVPSENGVVQMPTCTGKAGDLGGAHAKCVTLSAGATVSGMTVQSSDCITAGTSALLYPECAAAGCRYMVYVDGAPCVAGRVGCTDWARTYANSPGRVGCRYGEHWVAVDKCFMLERVYEASGSPVQATLANTDGNPETFTGPTPLPNPGPQPQPQPIPNGAPGGAPGTLPGGGVAPLPGLGGVPVTNGDCWGGDTFSWNPIDWVVTPVKCALAWAFVPSPAALANFSNGVGTAFGTTSFGRWSASVGGLVPAISGQGCAGPSLSTGFMSGLPGNPIPAVIHPFDACSAPMSTVAHVSYLILSAGIAFYGGMKVVRQLGYAFGFQIHAGSERSTFT